MEAMIIMIIINTLIKRIMKIRIMTILLIEIIPDHFTIKELVEKLKGQFECLAENTKKYINFFVNFDKNGKSKYNEYECYLKYLKVI